MRLRKWIVAAAAVVVGIPVALLIAGIVWIGLDLLYMRNEAKVCKPFIPVLERFRERHGAYPDLEEADRIDSRLQSHCHYRRSEMSYTMTLTGFSLQSYQYRAAQDLWMLD
jgi:hypothetical protein